MSPPGPGADPRGDTGGPAPPERDVLTLGQVELVGRMPWSSNATFLVEGCLHGSVVRAVYKPRQGEQPLWDFPTGLHRREVAAYELSRALGWDLVPLTVERHDGPLGPGSLQAFVDADFEQHYFTLLESDAHGDALRRLCAFDVVANSTDRKSGHVLVDRAGRIWAIDNGLSFHQEFKLRTVIWDFAGDEVPAPLLDDLCRLVERGLPDELASLLDPFERQATVDRARALVDGGRFPVDTTGRRYPWPLV